MDRDHANVLLIEDNPGDADLVRLRLVESKSDVHVNCVPRLSDALACLDAETPSLVLLDLNLPDSHGAETFRRIMQKAPNVPVVILSGQDDEALAIIAVHHGRSGLPGQGRHSPANNWSVPFAMRWNGKGCCTLWKSLASSKLNSRTSFCPTCRTNCARR